MDLEGKGCLILLFGVGVLIIVLSLVPANKKETHTSKTIKGHTFICVQESPHDSSWVHDPECPKCKSN